MDRMRVLVVDDEPDIVRELAVLLRRRGFAAADIASVRRAYKTLYREGLSLDDAKAALAEAARDAPVLDPLVAFLARSTRGIVR